MDMYPRYQSRFGYFNQDDQTDGYGVDHGGFSLRDELLYQTTRNKSLSKTTISGELIIRSLAQTFGEIPPIITVSADQI